MGFFITQNFSKYKIAKASSLYGNVLQILTIFFLQPNILRMKSCWLAFYTEPFALSAMNIFIAYIYTLHLI